MTNSKIILIMFIVLFILSLPTSFLSPSPAVSINKTGPSDISSIAFKTWSVVVPENIIQLQFVAHKYY